MDYEQFKNYVKENMEEVTGETVEIYPVVKNNSVIRDGLCIQSKDAGTAVPTIYLGKYFDSYKDGTPAPQLVRELMDFYETRKGKLTVNAGYFQNFSNLEDKVAYKLINRNRNKEQLERIPHKSFLDLELVYYLLFSGEPEGEATMLIEESHLAAWGVSKERIHQAAIRNTPRLLTGVCRPMYDVMRDIYRNEMDEEEIPDIEIMQLLESRQCMFPMYVLSNQRGLFGAAVMLYKDILKTCADKAGCNLFIIPSSVHEVLILPQNGIYTSYGLSEMVRQINREQIPPEEVLSDHVYIFHQKMGKIIM